MKITFTQIENWMVGTDKHDYDHLKQDYETMTEMNFLIKYGAEIREFTAKNRLEEIRTILQNEDISYGELVELQELKGYIEKGDVELLEAAGVPEFEEDEEL